MIRKLLVALIPITMVLGSCSKDFLDLKPQSQGSVDNFYNTAADIDQAVAGAYDALQSVGQYGQNFVYFMEVSSDNSKQESITNSGGVFGDFDLFRVVASNVELDRTWQHCYSGIIRCNIILDRIDPITMDETTKNIRKGEAKFLRALTYFNLVRIWGPVSLVTREVTNPYDAFEFGRSSVDSVYAQIIKDLQEAAGLLPVSFTGKDLGRATKIAAQTLLGKVYLTQKNYTAARDQLKVVIDYANANPNALGLLTNFADLFKVTSKNSKESIFEVQFLKGGVGEGSRFVNLFSPANTTQFTNGIGTALGDNEPTTNLADAYAANDVRKAVTIGTIADGRTYAKKYVGQDVPGLANDAGNNFIVLRYADVLLMYAEALNEIAFDASGTGDAWTYLNNVHQRAGLTAFTTANLANQGAFRLAVENERRFELAFENHRWFDLVRTGRAIEVMNTSGGNFTVKKHQLIFPVPQSQIDTNPDKIKQNPDYN
jgi:starch-binding outer membrane protein, SusD/RagB family